MTTASTTCAPTPRGFWMNWSGPILVCTLLALSLSMAITAVVLLTGKGKEGDREIPHAYEKAVAEATASRKTPQP